jgi:hypothetical protein
MGVVPKGEEMTYYLKVYWKRGHTSFERFRSPRVAHKVKMEYLKMKSVKEVKILKRNKH